MKLRRPVEQSWHWQEEVRDDDGSRWQNFAIPH